MKFPKTLGKWNRGDRIGAGGQGVVFWATGAEGEARAVIKIIGMPKQAHKRRARAVQEIRVQATLANRGYPNIMPIVDHNLEELEAGSEVGYIVMPFMPVVLASAIEILRERLELSLEVFRGILHGIAAAHAEGVIHRDIKPENILFADTSLRMPLVADFGICFVKNTAEEDRLTDANETVGAKWFMSPEQHRGGPIDVTEAADIYSLGKLFAHMLTGRYLAREELEEVFTPSELQADRRLERVKTELLAKTIVYDPAKRIQTANEVIAVVDQLLTEFRGGSPPPQPSHPEGPPAGPDETPTAGLDPTRISFEAAKQDISGQSIRRLQIRLNDLTDAVVDSWKGIEEPRALIEPEAGKAHVLRLLDLSKGAIGTMIALSKFDEVTLFNEFRKIVERLSGISQEDPGPLSVTTVPHVLAGFLYATTSVTSLDSESWGWWDRALSTKFRWHYLSGKPLYSYGFAHPYLFHAEAMKRSASHIHDLFRERLEDPTISKITGWDHERLLSVYVQTQFLMSVRAAQLSLEGEPIRMWADFGRFFSGRITTLLERLEIERDFAEGVLRPFGETPRVWFSHLNARLAYIRANFFGGSNYFWDSVESWETHNPAFHS